MILRQNKLTDLWRKFLHSIGCTSATEDVNEVHFEKLMKEKYVATPDKAITPTSMTIDENIIRYACGFVGMKLHD